MSILMILTATIISGSSANVLTILALVLGSGFGGWKLLVALVNKQIKQADNIFTEKQTQIEYTNESDKTFQETTINTLIHEYVNTNTWIRNQFETKFETLLTELHNSNKLSKDVYAQTDVFRRELRSLDKQTIIGLKEIKGMVSQIHLIIQSQQQLKSTKL